MCAELSRLLRASAGPGDPALGHGVACVCANSELRMFFCAGRKIKLRDVHISRPIKHRGSPGLFGFMLATAALSCSGHAEQLRQRPCGLRSPRSLSGPCQEVFAGGQEQVARRGGPLSVTRAPGLVSRAQ